LSFNGMDGDYSDPYPVNDEWVLLSSTRTGTVGGYDLYIAHVQSGAIWPMSYYNSSINTYKEELGVCVYIYDETVTDPNHIVGYPPEGYELVWSDEFNDTHNGLLNPNYWYLEQGGHGWGNNEEQFYLSSGFLGNDTVAKVKNGVLTITAFKLNEPYQNRNYISARVNTQQSWTYGYFEMRAIMPSGRGTWPAFWTLAKDRLCRINNNDYLTDGEIDILEYVGYEPDIVHASIHTRHDHETKGKGATNWRRVPNVEKNFNIYSMLWTENEVIVYINGNEYLRYTNAFTGECNQWPYYKDHYLKLNLAIGGSWGGYMGIDPDIFPARYVIDYVRVYQRKQN